MAALTDPEITIASTPAVGNACTRYGVAFPTVSAPTIVPTARPRLALNQVAIIFIAGGYTPARQKPQANRVATATAKPEAASSAALEQAPSTAAMAKSTRDGSMSARFSTATK